MFTTEDFEALRAGRDLDYIIVADGSGCMAKDPFGYFAAIYNVRDKEISTIIGGGSHGTNNLAECLPFLHAMWLLEKTIVTKGLRILCISDSEVNVKVGNGDYHPSSNQGIWAGLRWFSNNCYHVTWQHVSRNSNPINAHADRVAGNVRKNFSGE